MAIHKKYCTKCKGITETNISFDIDAAPGELAFIDICLRCEGKSLYFEREVDPWQRRLNAPDLKQSGFGDEFKAGMITKLKEGGKK